MRKSPRKSVVKWIEDYLTNTLKGNVTDELFTEIHSQIKECRTLEVEQVASAFDDGRIAQKFENRSNGKAYYRLNYYDENKNNN